MNVNDYYPLMIPPVIKDFEEFSKAETKQYFDWYVAQSEKRINQLQKYIILTGASDVVLNGTVSSLVPLWKWLEENVATEKKSEEELEIEMVGRPKWMYEEIRKNDWKFTTLTNALAVDVSFYFAQIFLNNYECIRWGYYTKPKNLVSVNRPVLVGFVDNTFLDPRRIVINCCRLSMHEKKETELLETYKVWTQHVPQAGDGDRLEKSEKV